MAHLVGVIGSSAQEANKSTSPPFDAALAELAARQHGRVALAQLSALGLTPGGVAGRVRSGRLHRVQRGVYAVGHRIETKESVYTAAVLACGPGAVLSHRSAADHQGLRPCARASVEVTVPGERGRCLRGIDSHASATLHPRDRALVAGIPCTTVGRTLLDLAEVIDRQGLARAVEQAERARIFDGREVQDVLARAAGRRGAPILRSILADYEGSTVTPEELERLFLVLCRRVAITRPRTQARIELAEGEVVYADFLWPEANLIVETDGYGTHGTRRAFERDRRRDRRLAMLGYRVIRFTWRDIERRPEEVAATLAALI